MSKLSCESSNSVLVSFMGATILTNAIIGLVFVGIKHQLLFGLSFLGGVIASIWIYRQEKKKVK